MVRPTVTGSIVVCCLGLAVSMLLVLHAPLLCYIGLCVSAVAALCALRYWPSCHYHLLRHVRDYTLDPRTGCLTLRSTLHRRDSVRVTYHYHS